MSQNVPKINRFAWTEKSEKAAILVAEDRLTNDAIAVAVGITDRTLTRWKTNKEFAARVEGHVADFAAAIRRRGIARLENRVDALNDRWNRMRRVIEARAEDGETDTVPGGSTGLIVRVEKSTRDGTIIEYSVDTGLLSELRAHEQQAAKELGQWEDRIRETVQDERPDLSRLTDDELADYERLTSKAAAAPQ